MTLITRVCVTNKPIHINIGRYVSIQKPTARRVQGATNESIVLRKRYFQQYFDYVDSFLI